MCVAGESKQSAGGPLHAEIGFLEFISYVINTASMIIRSIKPQLTNITDHLLHNVNVDEVTVRLAFGVAAANHVNTRVL